MTEAPITRRNPANRESSEVRRITKRLVGASALYGLASIVAKAVALLTVPFSPACLRLPSMASRTWQTHLPQWSQY